MSNIEDITTPIGALPAEVLLKIFHAFKIKWDPTTTARVRQDVGEPLQLTHVCRRWRITAVNDPSLWSHVIIVDMSPLYRLYLRRSAPLLIDLSIQIGEESDLEFIAEQIVVGLKHELDLSIKEHRYPATDRIRTVRLLTNAPPIATIFATVLDGYRLPSLTSFLASSRPIEDEIFSPSRSRFPFHPPIRQSPTLTFVALYGIAYGLRTQELRTIFSSCPQLQTIIIGAVALDSGDLIPSQNLRLHVPQLRTLVVASSIFPWYSRFYYGDCTENCPCIFRSLVASNLEYVEVAGEHIPDALFHLTPLINKRASETRQGKRRVQVMMNLNASKPAHSFALPGRHVLPISPNIHFHFFPRAGTYQEFEPERDVEAWLTGTRSTTFYIPAQIRELYPDKPPRLRFLPRIQPQYVPWHREHPPPLFGMVPVLLHHIDPTPLEPTESIEPVPRYDPPSTVANLHEGFEGLCDWIHEL